MSRIAIVHPTSLLAKEVRERLEARADLWTELRLLSVDENEVGLVTESAGAATFVGRLEEDSFADVDLAIFCGDVARDRPSLDLLPERVAAIIASRGSDGSEGEPRIAGIVRGRETAISRIVSPVAPAIALARLLTVLVPLGIEEASATVIVPASGAAQGAVDQLFAQARALLTFSSLPKSPAFAAQAAFNLLLLPGEGPRILRLVERVLDAKLPLGVQVVQAGVFHSIAISLDVRLARPPSAADLRRALAAADDLEMVRDGRRLGPVAAAGNEKVLVADPAPSSEDPGRIWIWAAMDNLVAEAVNVVRLAESLIGRPAA